MKPGGDDPLLSWLIFTGVTVFAFVLLWYFGLAASMVTGDRTHIPTIIVLLYLAASLHCLWRITIVSREATAAAQAGAIVTTQGWTALEASAASGLLVRHISALATKAGLQGPERLDPTLLLPVLGA